MTNFSDIFKKSFLEGYAASGLTPKAILTCIVITVLIATYIFIVYRLMNRNSFYNKSFNISLLAMAILTAAIILVIQSSIVVSLGMVGALSIVRFRTAIKDPMDLVFLFWSITVGIICGAGFAFIAVAVSVVLTIAIILADCLPIAKAPVILLVNSDSCENEAEIMSVVSKYCSLYKVKARNFTKDHLDMAIEVRVKEESGLMKEMMEISEISSASLVAHDGEVTF